MFHNTQCIHMFVNGRCPSLNQIFNQELSFKIERPFFGKLIFFNKYKQRKIFACYGIKDVCLSFPKQISCIYYLFFFLSHMQFDLVHVVVVNVVETGKLYLRGIYPIQKHKTHQKCSVLTKVVLTSIVFSINSRHGLYLRKVHYLLTYSSRATNQPSYLFRA